MILRSKALWVFVGSWFIGLPVGFVAATIYDRMIYEREPAPVRFDVGGALLLGRVVVGLAGTVMAI